jgi:hypothetical protein
MRNKFKLFLTTSFIIINLICYVIASKSYVGNQQLFFIYAISINFYLIYSFREKSFFFEKILSLFLWLGFWFKFVFVLIFSGNFREGTGNFDYSIEMFNYGIFVSSIAFISLISLSYLREKVLHFNYPINISSKLDDEKLKNFYINYRKTILIIFLLIVSFSAFMNVNFSIYRKGIIHNEDVPFLIMSLFKWLTIFGFCSFSSFILFYEMKINKNILLGILVSLYEGLVTNIGFMSRAMIFNQLAIYLGVLKNLELNKKKIKLINWFLYLSLLFITFFVSIYLVTIDRDNKFHNYEGTKLILENVLVVERVLPNNEETKDILEKRFIVDSFFQKKFKEYPILNNFIYLILNRWIGLDAVFAVVSSDKLSFSFFKKSLGEKFDSTTHSFYEMEILERKKLYIKHGIDKNYGIIIPGFIAFSFYAGSILIMSLVILMLYSISIVIEYISFKLSNSNVIFSSLIGQVCAYRLIHFGYLPSQSYLLLFSILLNIILFYLIISIFKLKK